MYPVAHAARDGFILDRRGPRSEHDPWRYQDLVLEDEVTDRQVVARTATVFLTGKECAWRCVMCDLWQGTTISDTPVGAISGQIAAARSALEKRGETVTQMKLYNASNFFDPRAVPDDDYDAIAAALEGLDRVMVESHPALIGNRVDRFLHALDRRQGARPARLEVAMGLETANPDALERLNKGLTLQQFSAAAKALRGRDVALRVFLLIAPPFIPASEQDRWLTESVDRAFSCGATVVSLIPTRAGNGAMEALADQGLYRAPDLADVERSAELALTRAERGRVLVDLWDLQRFSRCSHCLEDRWLRLRTMNLEQRRHTHVTCVHCGHGMEA
jgi:radical SAM enzyme (TIGR01210 family)